MRILAISSLLPIASAVAQGPAVLQDSITGAVDADVWRPFVTAFNSRNAEAFVGVHANNAMRWPLGWGQPQGIDSIAVQARRNWSIPPQPGESRTIELVFTYRSHTEVFAFDIGYYRVMVALPGGAGREFYGHFSTILGKENGKWRIWLDADNNSGVGLMDLSKGVPLKMK